LSNGLLRSAVNRAYHAMFYAALALLAERQTETSRHSGVIAKFDQLFVKPALFKKDNRRYRTRPAPRFLVLVSGLGTIAG
jgi:uncharacterized protein (UPF0332 family)